MPDNPLQSPLQGFRIQEYYHNQFQLQVVNCVWYNQLPAWVELVTLTVRHGLCLRKDNCYTCVVQVHRYGLSIPFFNLGKNVSRTVSLSTTLTFRSRSHPDWILNVNRIAVTPQELTSEVPNVAIHETASTVTSAKGTPTMYTSEDVELPSDIPASQISDIETSPIVEERMVNVNVDETESKTVGVLT